MSDEERHFKVSGMDDSLDPPHPPAPSIHCSNLVDCLVWARNELFTHLFDGSPQFVQIFRIPRGQMLMALRPLTSALPCRNQVNMFNVHLNNLSRDSFDDSLELSFGYFSARVNVGHVLIWYSKHAFCGCFCRLPPYTLLWVSLKM